VRERQQGGVAVEPRQDTLHRAVHAVLGGHHRQLVAAAEQLDRTLQHVQVGREVQVVADDAPAPGAVAQRGHHQLEQVHRGRVGDDHLVLVGADQPRDLGADALGRLEPALVPAADQAVAPLGAHQLLGQGGAGVGQPAQRVAVQVDQLGVGVQEARPKRRQLVLRVKLGREGGVGAYGHLNTPHYSCERIAHRSGKNGFSVVAR
jgi:hypothetical protein